MGKVDSSFLEEVNKKSGEDLSLCYQCLKCTAGCPTAPYMDIRPNNIIRMIQMGMKKEVSGKQCHLVLRLLSDLRDPLSE